MVHFPEITFPVYLLTTERPPENLRTRIAVSSHPQLPFLHCLSLSKLSCLQQRCVVLLTVPPGHTSWQITKDLGATNSFSNSRKCSADKGSLCKGKHYLLPKFPK